MNDFCKNVKRYRKDCHLTQEELGARVGITAQVVSNIERGTTVTVDFEILNKMAKVFGVSVQEITGGGVMNQGRDMAMFSVDNVFPERLKQLMSDQLIDIEQLSEKTGIAESRLDLYLYSRVQPIAEDLIRISQQFNVSIDSLLGLEDPEPPKEEMKLTEADKLFLKRYISLRAEQQEYLRARALVMLVDGAVEVIENDSNNKKSFPSTGTEG